MIKYGKLNDKTYDIYIFFQHFVVIIYIYVFNVCVHAFCDLYAVL